MHLILHLHTQMTVDGVLLLILGALTRISKRKFWKPGVDILSGRAVSEHVVFEMLH